MPHLLPGPESALACRLFHRRFREAELLAPRRKELGDVLDGIVRLGRSRRPLAAGLHAGAAFPARALIFILVGVMSISCIVRCTAAPRRTNKSVRPHAGGA